MRKLRLDIEGIRVESFGTVSADGAPGTVWAHSDASNKATCDTCVGPNCKPPPSAASGGDVCCA
ncbi:MAG TPA: hypothetical protein VGO40_14945 [Longimicrobium sp.]|jgi:hypothetical protein|nr:hypothetical protein [Longimicrobium sp.]